MRVLIVEDEEGLVSALKVGLQREGYAVDAALTASEASDRLALNHYDVALVDVNLPTPTALSSRGEFATETSTPTPDRRCGS